MLDAKLDTPLQPPPTSPEIPMHQRKEALWNRLVAEQSKTADRLGKGIDEGIKETVVVLNALGIPTRQSCEGHAEWGTGAPWVDVEAKGPLVELLEKKAEQAWERAENAEKEHATRDELERVFKEAHLARKEERAEHLKVSARLMEQLSVFYRDRQVPFDRRLILAYNGQRLESQGAAFQEAAEPPIKQQKLVEYQQEMGEFTAFLKETYFNDATPLEPGEGVAKMLELEHRQQTSEYSVSPPELEPIVINE